MTSAAVLLLMSVVGLSVSTVLITQAYRAEARQRQRSEESLRFARRTVEDMFVVVADSTLGKSAWWKERILLQLLTFYDLHTSESLTEPSHHQDASKVDPQVVASPEQAQLEGGQEASPAAIAAFQKMAAAIHVRNTNPQIELLRGLSRSQIPSYLDVDSPQLVPYLPTPQSMPASTGSSRLTVVKRLGDLPEASGLRLAGSTFLGGRGDQFGAALALERGHIYLAGHTSLAEGQSLAVSYRLPSAGSAKPVLQRATTWPKPGLPPISYERFRGVAASSEGVFFAGLSHRETIDSVRGKEVKSVLVKFPLDGSRGSDGADARWVARPQFFPCTGTEQFFAVAVARRRGSTLLYACGAGETSGWGNAVFVLTKYDADGNLLKRVTEPGVNFNGFACAGCSGASSLTLLIGHIYVAGRSQLTGFGEDNVSRPVLAGYDHELNRFWKHRERAIRGTFSGATGFDDSLYAVVYGQNSSDQDYLIQKTSEAGEVLWTTIAGGPDADALTGVVGVDGRLFAVGHTQSEGAGGERCRGA